MLITSRYLKGACRDQRDLFNKTFPVGAEFNKPNWDLALSVGLEVKWMERFLDDPAWEIYKEAIALARKIYKETTEPAMKIYNEAIESALKIYYEESETSTWEIYKEAIMSAWEIYKEAIESDLKMYKEVEAPALFNVLEQQFNGVK